jgi:hypothetical protein
MPETSKEQIPWYSVVEDEALEQGDILPCCPVFRPRADLVFPIDAKDNYIFEKAEQAVIVMSQSCDLVPGREKVTHCLLCSVATLSSTRFSDNAYEQNQIKNNRHHHVHYLAKCPSEPWKDEELLVSFRDHWSLPLPYVMNFAKHLGPRLRLNSPYRENLSQRFGFYFSRVALPEEIPQTQPPNKQEARAARYLDALDAEDLHNFLAPYLDDLRQDSALPSTSPQDSGFWHRIARFFRTVVGKR